ncbi:MAG: hypothetical protein ACREH5_05590 [Candidatus Omnitrophota bacterium]
MKSASAIKANSFLSFVYFNPLFRATRKAQRKLKRQFVSRLRGRRKGAEQEADLV